MGFRGRGGGEPLPLSGSVSLFHATRPSLRKASFFCSRNGSPVPDPASPPRFSSSLDPFQYSASARTRRSQAAALGKMRTSVRRFSSSPSIQRLSNAPGSLSMN